MAVPFLVAAVRELLGGDPVFTDIVPLARITTRKPSDVTTPYALVSMVGNYPIDAAAGAYTPWIQVSVYSANLGDETRVFQAAARAADVFARTRAALWRGAGWRPSRVTDGPTPTPDDVSRGGSDPVVGAYVRVECKVHAPT